MPISPKIQQPDYQASHDSAPGTFTWNWTLWFTSIIQAINALLDAADFEAPHGSATGATGSVTLVTIPTTGVAGSFQATGYVNILTRTAGILNFTLSYVDDMGVPRTVAKLAMMDENGNVSGDMAAVGVYHMLANNFQTDGNGPIVLAVAAPGFVGTFNAYGSIV